MVGVAKELGLRLLRAGAVRLRDHAEQAMPVHSEQDRDSRGASGEGGDDHVPGLRVKVAQHGDDSSGPFARPRNGISLRDAGTELTALSDDPVEAVIVDAEIEPCSEA